MKSKTLNRTLGILISVLLFCAGIPAQGPFGPRRMISSPTPTLKGQLSPGQGLGSGRPRLSFGGKIGGLECFEPSIRRFRTPELTFSAKTRSSVIAKQRARGNGKYSSRK